LIILQQGKWQFVVVHNKENEGLNQLIFHLYWLNIRISCGPVGELDNGKCVEQAL
jgi:hypothetical protein